MTNVIRTEVSFQMNSHHHCLISSVHLCNNAIQRHLQPSNERHPSVPRDNMWSSSDFKAFLQQEGRGAQWDKVVVPGMQQAVVHVLQTAQDQVEHRKGTFELYGADFMLGNDLRPWLLEVNANPTMACTSVVTTRLCPAVQLDMLKVVLDRRNNPNAFTGGFRLIYKQVMKYIRLTRQRKYCAIWHGTQHKIWYTAQSMIRFIQEVYQERQKLVPYFPHSRAH